MLQCWQRMGHLPSFFVPFPGMHYLNLLGLPKKKNELTSTENAITYHNTWISISIVFSFFWGHFNSQEKLKTMLRQILEWPTKSIMVCYGIFCSGQLYFARTCNSKMMPLCKWYISHGVVLVMQIVINVGYEHFYS